jgi:hypothetical protein
MARLKRGVHKTSLYPRRILARFAARRCPGPTLIPDATYTQLPRKHITYKQLPSKQPPSTQLQRKQLQRTQLQRTQLQRKQLQSKPLPCKRIPRKQIPCKRIPCKRIPCKRIPLQHNPTPTPDARPSTTHPPTIQALTRPPNDVWLLYETQQLCTIISTLHKKICTDGLESIPVQYT